MKTIAVIINNKNDGKYLPQIFRAFQQQENQDFSIYGIDAGSVDDSVEIYHHHHIPVIGCNDLNQAQSVNKVIKLVEEPIIHWINADDLPLHNCMKKHLQVFQDPTISIVYSDCIIFHEHHPNWQPYEWKAKNLEREFLAGRNPIVHPTVMIRRKLFEYIGALDESFTYAIDYEFWARAWRKGIKFGYIPEATAKFRSRNDSLTKLKRDDILAEMARIHQMYGFGDCKRA